MLISCTVAAMAQLISVFASHAEDWVFESRQRETQVVKTSRKPLNARQQVCGLAEMTIKNGFCVTGGVAL